MHSSRLNKLVVDHPVANCIAMACIHFVSRYIAKLLLPYRIKHDFHTSYFQIHQGTHTSPLHLKTGNQVAK